MNELHQCYFQLGNVMCWETPGKFWTFIILVPLVWAVAGWFIWRNTKRLKK